MAERNLDIVITARNNADKELKSLGNTLERNKATIQKTAMAATAAFGTITALAGVAVKAAADSQVAWAKFDVVFGDSADDMRDFVKDMRSDIPLASRVIAKMTAGLGDMLVPMGFARDEAAEMSKNFVRTAAGVAAFNNVDPSEVLNAISSGLAGSGQALRRFGINADVGRLEMLALEKGLLQSGQTLASLDSETRRFVQSQALMEAVMRDSADAVAGLEKEKETLAFKMAQASATTQELRELIGNALIPVVLRLVEAVQPVIERVAEWIEKNPELTRNIILASLAITGLIAVVSTVTLMMMAFNPVVGLVVVAIASVILVVQQLTRYMATFGVSWGDVWNGIKNVTSSVINGIISMIESYINYYVTAINTVIRAINRVISAASRIPGIGKKFSGLQITELSKVEFGRVGQEDTNSVNVTVYGDVSGSALMEKVGSGIMGTLMHNVRV